jgi:hypothetical protein
VTSSVLAQIQRGKGSDGKGKGVGSERAPRRTRLKSWSGLGRLGRGSPAVAVAAAVWWRGEQGYGKGVGNQLQEFRGQLLIGRKR